MVKMLYLLVGLAAHSVLFLGAEAAQLRSKGEIEQAFEADGFKVTRWVTIGDRRGAEASSVNVTNLGTKQPKKAYYVEGNGYEMGYLTGLLAPDEVQLMARDYVNRFIPSLVAPALEKMWENSTLWEALCDVIGGFFVSDAFDSFKRLNASGFFPASLVSEMQGIVDGVAHAKPSAAADVTLERIATLSYGMDFLSVWMFAGEKLPNGADAGLVRLRQLAHQRLRGSDLQNVLALLSEARTLSDVLHLPVFCDAFGVWGSAVKESNTVLFARDFQLTTCDVFQDISGMWLYHPTDGRHSLVSITAPGIVGSITVVNTQGVAMGVDTLRSAFGNVSWPGLNSVLLLRHISHSASSSQEALQLLGEAHRGCPYLYPLCDLHGDCAVVESGAYMPGPASQLDPLGFVTDQGVLPLLPNRAFIQSHNSSSLWLSGAYARHASYSYPKEYLEFNPALFQKFGVPFNSSGWSSDSFVFGSWQDEDSRQQQLSNNYFPPLRGAETGDFIIVSNLAIVPEMRLTMMTGLDDFFAKHQASPQWRYDSLNHLIRQHYGSIDLETAKDIITFLSPDRTPGYWNDTLIPGDPMSAQIEGTIAVAELHPQNLQVWLKSGYWADGWVHVHPLRYF